MTTLARVILAAIALATLVGGLLLTRVEEEATAQFIIAVVVLGVVLGWLALQLSALALLVRYVWRRLRGLPGDDQPPADR